MPIMMTLKICFYGHPTMNNIREPRIDSFKDFDYKGYDVRNRKKADSLLKKAWDKLRRATDFRDMKLVAGIALAIFGLVGMKDNRVRQILFDIVRGRMSEESVENIGKVLQSILTSLSGKKQIKEEVISNEYRRIKVFISRLEHTTDDRRLTIITKNIMRYVDSLGDNELKQALRELIKKYGGVYSEAFKKELIEFLEQIGSLYK